MKLIEKFDSRYVVGGALLFFIVPQIEVPGIGFALPLGVFATSLMTAILIATGRMKVNDRYVMVLALFVAVLIASGLYGFLFVDAPVLPDGTIEENFRFSRWRFTWQIGAWILGFGSALYFAYVLRSIKLLRKFPSIVLIGGGLVTAFGFYELASAGFELPNLYPSNGDWIIRHRAVAAIGDFRFDRPYGTFSEPKILAKFLLYPIFTALMLWITSGRKLVLVLGLAAFMLFISTFSTAAFAGFAVGFVVFVGLNIVAGTRLHRKTYPLLIAGAVVVVVVITAAFSTGNGSLITYHFARFDDALTADVTVGFNQIPGQAVRGRTTSVSTDYILGWDRGIKLFTEHPIFGVGLGNSIFFMGVFDRIFTPFSLHILLLAETGIIGYAVFVSMVGVFVYPPFASIRKNRPFTLRYRTIVIPMISGFAGSLVTYQIHGGARFDATDWLVIGVLVAVGRVALARPGYGRR